MTHPHTDNPTTPPPDLETHIRQIIHTAHQNGHPTPGRPTLIRQTGATDHAVKRILATLNTERHQTTTPPDSSTTSTTSPGHVDHPQLALVTTSSGDKIQHHTHTGDSTTSAGDHIARPTTSPGDHQPSHTASYHQATSPGDPTRQVNRPGFDGGSSCE